MNYTKLVKRLLTLVAGPIVVAYLGYFLFVRRGQLMQVFDIEPATFAGLAAFTLLTMSARTYQFKLMLSVLDTRISLGRAACLILSGQLMNYLLFRPGTLMQAVILKRETSLKYASFLSLFTAQLILLLVTASVLAVLGLLLTSRPLPSEGQIMLLFFAAAMVVPVLILCTPKGWVAGRRTRVEQALYDLLSGWQQLRTQPARLAAVIAMIVLRLLATAARLWLCFLTMQVEAGFLACLTLAAVIQLTFIINFTPGGLGLRQILVGGAAIANGLTFEQGMFASSLDHAVGIIMTLLTGVPALLFLLRGRQARGDDRIRPAN